MLKQEIGFHKETVKVKGLNEWGLRNGKTSVQFKVMLQGEMGKGLCPNLI